MPRSSPHGNQVHRRNVTTTPGLISAERVLDERDDKVAVGPYGHVMKFRFVNYGRFDGVDFTTSCAPLISFDLKTDGHQLATERLVLGHTDSHPTSNPFVAQRAG